MANDPLVAVEAELCRRSLARFARDAWPQVESDPWLDNWHIDYLADIFTGVYTRQLKRVVITMPPRYGKSYMAQTAFPAWVWAKFPGEKLVFASHTEDLAIEFSTKRRKLLESEWYKARFGGDVEMSQDQNQKWLYKNSANGSMQAVGIDTKITGWGGNILMWDDLLIPRERRNTKAIKKMADFLSNTWLSRLNNKQTGAMVGIMQRLATYDPAGICIEAGWEHFNLPGLAEKKCIVVFPVSGREVVREENTALWEEREPLEKLEELREKQPEFFFTQYQQRPTTTGGSIVKKESLQFWTELPAKFDQWLQTWDLTLTDTARSDFVVGQVWGRIGPHKYLVYQVRRRANLQATFNMILDTRRLYPLASATHIEQKANGYEAIRHLKNKLSGIIPYNPDRDKRSRLQAVEDEFESQCVFVPHPSKFPWVQQYVERLCAFDGDGTVDFDDEIDCTTLALLKLRVGVGASISVPKGVGSGLFRGGGVGVGTFGDNSSVGMMGHGKNPFAS